MEDWQKKLGMKPEPLTYNVTQVAEKLALSKASVYAGLKSGVIPHIQIGRSFRIPRVAFELWLAHAGKTSTN